MFLYFFSILHPASVRWSGLAGLGNGLFYLLHDLCDLHRHLLHEIVLVNSQQRRTFWDLGTEIGG